MTEATIKHLATELAGTHYDFVRSHEQDSENLTARWPGGTVQKIEPRLFCKTYPTLKDYLAGRKHGRKVERFGAVYWEDTGEITQGAPAYLFFYEIARQMLVQMLGRPDVSEDRKRQIFEAIKEDREKQLRDEARMIKSPSIPQAKFLGR